jgi:hypothetical protein
MRLKFLLFVFLLWGGLASAQDEIPYFYEDTINYLVITEYRGDVTNSAYLELTNMGNEPVQLNQFKIGHWGANATLDYETGKRNPYVATRIWVDKVLQPGESYVFASVKEYGPRMYAKGLEGYSEKITQDKMWEYADFHVHLPEGGDSTDIVTPDYDPFDQQWGGNGFFIEQHFANGDSIIVDQVGGTFTGTDGKNPDRTNALSHYPVAGMEDALRNAILVRKASVKTGNLNFNEAKGVGLDDSEWIPIPIHGQAWRDPMWTVGNHGDFKLDENTLISDVIDVDFANKTLTVPWGVRRGDDIMNYFEQKPGIGWEYVMSAEADSLTHACQTGDQLFIYVCGDERDFAAFDIVVKEPEANANMLVTKAIRGLEPDWENNQIASGSWGWPRITQHESGIDSIWGARGGIPYATRVDSLLKQLDKPSNADWEIVYAGQAKPDIAHGDKIKVTAQDGSVKEYFIAVLPYRANGDATLTAIQWPDIPEFYKGLFGWVGDTIPGFGPQVPNYNIEVPLMAQGIPALVTTKSDPNAKVEVKRATSLSGSADDRTINFTVTAEDDSTQNMYNVLLTKEKDPTNQQPFVADPFISEVSHNLYWNGNDYAEIYNPGNQPVDLSNYMIAMSGSANPSEIIATTNAENWLMRYEKYIPGYKWAPNEASWIVDPYKAELDLSVDALVYPGEVFVMAAINNENAPMCRPDWTNPAKNANVQFYTRETLCNSWENQWGEEINNDGTPFGKWHTNIIYLFKILNDSIKQGLKPATDPLDFELIDVLGKEDGTLWTLGDEGISNPFSLRRKPHIYGGNPNFGALGTSPEDAEYSAYNLNYYADQGQGWPWRMLNIVSDIGKHFMFAPTHYISTVSSVVYKVSEGYQSAAPHGPQTIRGITTGTTVTNFLANIIKANENQSLTVTSTADGTVMAMDALLSLNDTLTVLSADSINTTKYVLHVSEEGLSSDAVLTSARYEITIDAEPKSAGDAHTPGSGSITGFEYGTTLQTVVNNVTVPAGAAMSVISGDGAYVPFKRLNFDTAYVSVTVNADTYFEVLAENGVTSIKYQLLPRASESAAFVLSDVYSVKQSDLLIELVPRGMNAQSFLSNLIPSLGATMKLVDKWGFERIDGIVADDDRLMVTSADGTVTVTYHIGKLATEYIPANTYLAYILSDVYGIDQVEYKIHGASGIADISEFYARIRVAQGATAVVVDSDGNEKTTGDINGTDMVRVTSADGKIVVMYTFGPLTDANAFRVQNQMEFYPNPTSGILNVSGIEKGQRIQVYNAVGTAVLDIKVNSNREVIPLQNEPAGMYLIVVSKENQLIGRYKAIKK